MAASPATMPLLRASYEDLAAGCPLGDDVLLAIGFGSQKPLPSDPRCVRIDLEQLAGASCLEVWRGRGAVRVFEAGLVRYAEDGEHCAGWLSIGEEASGGLAAATEAAYRSLLRFHAGSPYHHVLRMWNYISDINTGAGDQERYRQFCLGRACAFSAGTASAPAIGYPAASAVGKRSASRSLEICWIAGRAPGVAIENPRQVSAYEYPRQYGPAAPSFSRATVTAGRLLLISGTASIVGHTSMHAGDPSAQFDETVRNIDTLLQRSVAESLIRLAGLSRDSLVRVYLRNASDAASVEQKLRRSLGSSVPVLILTADISRADLLIEVEVAHQG